jgi:hypothetical protein
VSEAFSLSSASGGGFPVTRTIQILHIWILQLKEIR